MYPYIIIVDQEFDNAHYDTADQGHSKLGSCVIVCILKNVCSDSATEACASPESVLVSQPRYERASPLFAMYFIFCTYNAVMHVCFQSVLTLLLYYYTSASQDNVAVQAAVQGTVS